MAEEQQRFGDGQDNFLHGAQKGLEAVRKASAAAGQAAANTAAVQAGVAAGGTAAEVAAGAAAGGPVGAAVSAAWSMRHTLFKVLVFLCLFLLFVIISVISLPSVVTNNIFHTDPPSVDFTGPTELKENFDDLAATVSGCIQGGYQAALNRVEQIIASGSYDRDLSIEALINNALVSTDYDTCYVLAAYSASMLQRGAGKADMKAKLDAVAAQMYPVTYVVRHKVIPTSPPSPPAGGAAAPAAPQTTVIYYVVCTIHPFEQSVIRTAFNIDENAPYDQFPITCGEAIASMSQALKMTMYGTLTSGMVPPITDAELNAFLDGLTCSGARKELMRTALSLVGRVPYFWGGKSAPGWNEDWNTPRLVTSAGSSSTGTIRPYGLDCSGFTEWVYQTALGVTLYDGSWNQWDATYAISASELLPGDLGFMAVPGTVPINHVLLYAGTDTSGKRLWVHCSSGSGGVALNSPSYVTQFRRRKNVNLETD